MAGSIKSFLSKFASKSKDEESKFIDRTSVTFKEDKLSAHPNKAWERRKKSQTCKTLKPIDATVPCKSGSIRFVCISDTHTILEKQGKDGLQIPEGDVLLHAGDFTMYGTPDEVSLVNEYLDGDVLLHAGDFTMYGTPDEVSLVNEYLGTLPHKYKIVIAGNHDVTFDLDLVDRVRSTRVWKLNDVNYEKRLEHYGVKTVHEMLTNCIYLQDSMVKVHGINIYGAPWQPGGGSWGFNCHRGMNLLDKWNKIPENTDILLTHGPPCGHGDNVNRSILKKVFDPRGGIAEHHVGCVDLLNTIQNRVRPKYHVFGHIHEGYGMTSDGKTTFINAAICDEHYRARNEPIVFDVPINTKSKLSECEFEWVIPTVLPEINNLSHSIDNDYLKAECDCDDILFCDDDDNDDDSENDDVGGDDDDKILFCDDNAPDDNAKSETNRKTKIKENQQDDDDDLVVLSEEAFNDLQANSNINRIGGSNQKEFNKVKNTPNFDDDDDDDDDFILFSDQALDQIQTTSCSDKADVFKQKQNIEEKKKSNCDDDDDDDRLIVFHDGQTNDTESNLSCSDYEIVLKDAQCDEIKIKSKFD